MSNDSEPDRVSGLPPTLRISAGMFAFCILVGFLVETVQAQHGEAPRTRTFTGLVSPAFPYAQPEEVGLSSEKLTRLGDEIADWTGAEWVYNAELVGAELLVVKDGKAVFHESYGWSDREDKIPVQRNSIWSIKSMSKPFTATAVLMLVDEGKLSLDDPVRKHFGGFAGDGRVTIRHLLSHTSGYREEVGDPGSRHGTLKQWIEDWASTPPAGAFGEYRYSDFNYGALGYIVEVVSGVPIDQFTEQRIIAPLGLEDTSTGFSGEPAWLARLNPWYRWNGEYRQYDLRWPKYRTPWPFYTAAWGMFSTAMDYAKFMGMWVNGGEWKGARLLSREGVEEALKPHARERGHGAYGYGWYLGDVPMEEGGFFAHGGGDGTIALAFPADDAVLVYMTHSRGGGHHAALWNRVSMSGLFEHPGFGLMYQEMGWVEEGNTPEVVLEPSARERYVGSYSAAEGGDYEALRIWEQDGLLHIRLGQARAKADLRYHLVPIGGNRFGLGRYERGQLRALDPVHGLQFHVKDGAVTGLAVTKGDKIIVSAERVR